VKTLHELLQAAGELLRLLSRRLFGWVSANANSVRTALLLVVIAALLWNYYRHAATRNITILSGPGGGTGAVDAKKLAQRFEQSSRIYREMYSVAIQPTAGFEENRQAISEDPLGKTIAFAHDGFGPSDRVRVLLPLEFNFLHIICHREFLREARGARPLEVAWRMEGSSDVRGDFRLTWAQSNKERPLTFDQLVPLLQEKAGRVYFGPRESGTRQMAEIVARQFNLPVRKLASYSYTSFDDMRIALRRHDIDVAFYCGPLNAEIMRLIAEDGQSTLVGLSPEVQSAILQARPNLSDARFTAHSYLHGEFCPDELATIASRRVIICSSLMGDRLAFRLASLSYEALRDNLPELQWQNVPPAATSTRLAYQIHPGADRFRLEEPITWLPPTLQSILALVLIWSLTEVLASVSRRLKESEAEQEPPPPQDVGDAPPAPETPPSPSHEFKSLQEKIELLAGQLPTSPEGVGRKQRIGWRRNTEQILSEIRQARVGGRLSEREFDSLIVGVEKELNGPLATQRGLPLSSPTKPTGK
jgi:TRAP-type uncharacterized transport system substrate-binding protein